MKTPRKKCSKCSSNHTVLNGYRILKTSRKRPKWYCTSCRHYFTPIKKYPLYFSPQYLNFFYKHLSGSSLRVLSTTYQISKKQILKYVHFLAKITKDSLIIALHLKPSWSGTLLFSDKKIFISPRRSPNWRKCHTAHDKKSHPVWLCGLDCETGDLPHYKLIHDKKISEFRAYFRDLRSIKYPLHVIVCPHDKRITTAVHQVFGSSVVVQYCTKHFIHSLRKKAIRCNNFKKSEKIISLIEKIITAKTIEATYEHIHELNSIKSTNHSEEEILTAFKNESARLAAHLLHINFKVSIPHTLTELDHIFCQISKRLKAHRAFSNHENAHHFLKSWALLYRLTPQHHHSDDKIKTPLERAGVHIIKIKPAHLFEPPAVDK